MTNFNIGIFSPNLRRLINIQECVKIIEHHDHIPMFVYFYNLRIINIKISFLSWLEILTLILRWFVCFKFCSSIWTTPLRLNVFILSLDSWKFITLIENMKNIILFLILHIFSKFAKKLYRSKFCDKRTCHLSQHNPILTFIWRRFIKIENRVKKIWQFSTLNIYLACVKFELKY